MRREVAEELAARLGDGPVLVGDGAWGTQLFGRGLRAGAPPETFNLERPGVLEEIARQYLEAGAEILTTNTFGASPLALARHGLADETEALNRAAVEALRRAAGNRAWIAASIGPCGRLLRPHGDVEPEAVASSFARQARALAREDVDLFCVETMTDLAEARLAVRAARAAAPAVPIVATMTFERTRRGYFTVMGVSVADAARGLAEAGADAVGSNCGNGIDAMVEIAAAFREATTLPLQIRANAGLPESRAGVLAYPEAPDAFAARVPDLVAAGVRILGGCCGTTPAHVRAIARALGEVS